MNDRQNTIAGWVLFASVIALGTSLVVGEVFHGEEIDSCEEGATDGYCPAYVAEASAAAAGGAAEAEEPIAFYLATADASRGETVFAKCTACHNAAAGGPNALGPNLYGVMGSNIASKAGFAYSDALSGIDGSWQWDNMSEWLRSPRGFAPGNKMTFAGLGDPQDRADLMLWLNQQGSSLAVPPPPEPGAEGEEAAEDAATEGDAQTAQDTNTAEDLTDTSAEGTGSEGGVEVPEATE
ncbi:cytochrome c family protein [Sphingomicrobium sp. XHP0239]|uniref:c-type cytochrome n=1 Tax=Sphingomicrobium maritimum TaxID=3133972 RepID=UPI0031CCB6AF